MNLSYRNDKNAHYIASLYNRKLENIDYYKIDNVSEDEAELLIYDYIGYPFNDAKTFINSIESMKQSKITIRINSPGGDVFDGFAIANAIKAHPSKPITRIESLAASAASFIAMAGHEKQAYKNTMIMIHEPMTGMYGNQYELREVADILTQISNNMVDMYADNTNIGKREIKAMLKAETWMTAKEAKEKGFVDKIIESGEPVKASFDMSIFAKSPDSGLFAAADLVSDADRQQKDKDLSIRNIEKLLRDAGLSKDKAKAVLARGWKAMSDDIDDNSITENGFNKEAEIEIIKAALELKQKFDSYKKF